MDFSLETNNKKLTLGFFTRCNDIRSIRTIVENSNKPNTIYAEGNVRINPGDDNFYIRMPQSPEKIVVRIFDEAEGYNTQKSNTFNYECRILPLKQKLDSFDFTNVSLMNFVHAMQEFAEDAGVLSAGMGQNQSIRMDNSGMYRFHYVDYIESEPSSIAMINSESRRITFARQLMLKSTVPGRFCVGMHEYSHGFKNREMENEEEADWNAMKICLGLGYPRKEIYHVFANIFKSNNTFQNRKRAKKIEDFLFRWENESGQGNTDYYYIGEKRNNEFLTR